MNKTKPLNIYHARDVPVLNKTEIDPLEEYLNRGKAEQPEKILHLPDGRTETFLCVARLAQVMRNEERVFPHSDLGDSLHL